MTRPLPHVRAIMGRLARAQGMPEPSLTEIARKTRDPFKVLMSCLLSLRTRDETTRSASARLYALGTTPAGLGRIDEGTLARAIYPVSFFRTKAKRIREICARLLERHGGRVPDTMEALLALPGVGRKTANIVLVYGFGLAALPIDTHCHRIPNRIGWFRTRTPEETERVLRARLPRRYWKDFNDLFVRHGQTVCKPIGPRCGSCPIEPFCAKKGVPRRR